MKVAERSSGNLTPLGVDEANIHLGTEVIEFQ